MILKALNPTGTGKLVLFETNYGTSYEAIHYLVFIFLGVAGGLWGGVFCKCNFLWSKSFRQFRIIKNNPVFEVFLVVLATGLLQYPNPMTREPGDIIVKTVLQDCNHESSAASWLCQQEAMPSRPKYIGWLVYGTVVKLILTIITFGCKVPSGVIIPALDAGAFFGRLIGQVIPNISPGIFAMVGAAAFLAGVSRMTISLCVIMFELTGELEYIVPHMIAILVAKWVADALEKEGVYDLAQTVLGHPFLDPDQAMTLVQREGVLVEELIPPKQTMQDITVLIGRDNTVSRHLLEQKLEKLKQRGLMDAGLVLVREDGGMLQGYLAEGELEFGLNLLGETTEMLRASRVKLLSQRPATMPASSHYPRHSQQNQHHLHHHHHHDHHLVNGGDTMPDFHDPTQVPEHGYGHEAINEDELEDEAEDSDVLDLTSFVDATPLTVCAKAPMEYAVEMFGKLGLRYLCVVEEGTGRLVGVIIKKRLVNWLDGLKE